MFKIKTAEKWLSKKTKTSIRSALKKHLPQIKLGPLISTPALSIPSETLKEQKIHTIKMERIKAQSMEFVRRNQIR